MRLAKLKTQYGELVQPLQGLVPLEQAQSQDNAQQETIESVRYNVRSEESNEIVQNEEDDSSDRTITSRRKRFRVRLTYQKSNEHGAEEKSKFLKNSLEILLVIE